ncbi:hypothetical protein [Butyrivibrio sp. VCB2006]|uniref:hypothetical protein n=1 Tax=Butyrivibrio sp. VCB2006 TaxID=1280679 RepID=UPI0003F5194B|nr:hypothetical protein [Butyrivibrio sp. VCB2006]
MSGKKFFITSLILILGIFLLFGGMVFYIDPFFHYRAPNGKFYYELYEQRSQNDGITKYFDYDSMIIGTSMAENFKASLFDELMGTNSVKVSYSGATYKELNDDLMVAYRSGHDPKYVLRPLDYSLLVVDKDEIRTDMGEYPVWLTNSNPFDDVKYLLNRDVIINYTLPVILRYIRGVEGGYTSFDEYSYTGDNNVFSKELILQNVQEFTQGAEVAPTSEDYTILTENMEQNVVSLARMHPETTFLYFFPPYSMAYWGGLRSEGKLNQMLEYKKAAIEQMLECDNIHIYSFTLFTDITTNLDNYRDVAHYCPEVNDFIMKNIADGEEAQQSEYTGFGRITAGNKDEYLLMEKEYLNSFDYGQLLK